MCDVTTCAICAGEECATRAHVERAPSLDEQLELGLYIRTVDDFGRLIALRHTHEHTLGGVDPVRMFIIIAVGSTLIGGQHEAVKLCMMLVSLIRGVGKCTVSFAERDSSKSVHIRGLPAHKSVTSLN